MTLGAEDRTAITDLINTHGHLVDAGELERIGELFTDDAVYDVTDLGGGVIEGLAAFVEASLAMGDRNPVAHHVTNIVLTGAGEGRARARSKGIGINADGTCGSVTYEDTVERRAEGWRITHRRVLAHRVPLGGR